VAIIFLFLLLLLLGVVFFLGGGMLMLGGVFQNLGRLLRWIVTVTLLEHHSFKVLARKFEDILGIVDDDFLRILSEYVGEILGDLDLLNRENALVFHILINYILFKMDQAVMNNTRQLLNKFKQGRGEYSSRFLTSI